MKYDRFEQIPVWQDALQPAVGIYTLTDLAPFRGHGELRDQIRRAAVSISSNIAEGYERGTTQELLTFLYIARGSAGEVRSQLCLMEQLPDFRNLKSQISNLKSLSENVSRQLRGFADYLQNTKIKGQRYLTEELRRAEQAARSQAEFLEYLRRVQEQGRAQMFGQPRSPEGDAP